MIIVQQIFIISMNVGYCELTGLPTSRYFTGQEQTFARGRTVSVAVG